MHLLNKPFSIGKISKTHGLKGDVSVALRSEVFDKHIKKDDFLYVEFEGKPVPFKIESWNNQSDICGLSLCNNVEQAMELVGHLILVDFKDISAKEYFPYNLIGLELVNNTTKENMGKINDVQQAVGQVWLLLEGDSEIPFHEDFFDKIDDVNLVLHLNLPLGIDDL